MAVGVDVSVAIAMVVTVAMGMAGFRVNVLGHIYDVNCCRAVGTTRNGAGSVQ
jgi:hypothetical protein